jgi:hypothetical protein
MAAIPIGKIPLSPEWRRALEMLADAGQSGSAEAALIERGFSPEMLASLVRTGLAIVTTDTVRIGGRTIKAPHVRITNAGRFTLRS